VRRHTVVALALIMIFGLAGCAQRQSGSGSYLNEALSADKLEQAMEDAWTAATAYRLQGDVAFGGASSHLDLHFGQSSTDGYLSTAGFVLRIRYIHPDLYVRAGFNFWYAAAAHNPTLHLDPTRLSNKWVLSPPGSLLGDLARYADRTQAAEQLRRSTLNGTFSSGPTQTIKGVLAASITDQYGSVIYVRDRGTPYPLHLEGPESTTETTGTIDFSGWNVPFDAPRPPAEQIVTLVP